MAGWVTRFVLPWPPSANRYWRHDRGVTHRSADADAYIAEVACLTHDLRYPRWWGDEPMAVSLVAYFPYPRKGDLDNRIKILLDAMAHGMRLDDARFWRVEAVRRYDKRDPRVLVRLSSFEDTGESGDLYAGCWRGVA